MKLLPLVAFGALVAGATRPAPPSRPPATRATLAARVDSLDHAIAALGTTLGTTLGTSLGADTGRARVAFRHARTAYKLLEGAIAYYSPPTVAALNGVEEEEGDDNPNAGRVVARGFQRVEHALYDAPTPDSATARALLAETARMRSLVAHFRAAVPYIAPDDAQLLELARLEVARVSTLGIAGVDATSSRDAMSESATALDGVRDLLGARDSLGARLAHAAAYLRATPDFVAFDRFTFVTRYAEPVFAALADAARHADTPRGLRRTWPAEAANVYDVRAFDIMSYAPHDAPRPTEAWARLGASLFFDPRLSGPGTRSCASCHLPGRAFSDGLRRARSIAPNDSAPLRHTPPLRYAAWQPAQFADGRAATLEAQLDSVLASRAEMGSSVDTVVARLARSDVDRARFAAASGEPPERAVTARAVRTAMASYLRTLAHFDAPFDRAMRGDSAALSDDARRGFNVFMGKAGCGTCHFAPLFNGAAPPDFSRASPEIIGVPTAVGGREVDPDLGRGAVDRLAGHAHAFKTPTVRDAALGGPYMHNGALRTLDELLDFYDKGGGAGAGVTVPNQTLSDRPLDLSPRDRADLVAFLRSLVEPPVPFSLSRSDR